ncbi:MAG: SIR2 family protein, partial [Lachnospiraceae bacterium]|nr:SIR2 family protein [Lachnospiraceae bacterium]
MRETEFIKEYSEAIQSGRAAVFAGAGLSAASGFVNWKKLLEPLAEEIGLSMDREHDYLAVAQYYYNQKKTRSRINDAIYNMFASGTRGNKSLEIITRLPVDTYWTTNYDHLLEDGLRANNRMPDPKITQENLAVNLRDASAAVYKMHGDIQFPDQTVLIKNDYETYGLTRNAFTTVLKGHLLSKTFLFIGFSFEDPNLRSILAWIKALLRDSVKGHYCLMKAVAREKGESKTDFAYRKARQDLNIEDLMRYGIETVLVKSYDDIPRVLEKIEKQCNLRNVFLSGSMSADSASWT